MSKDVIYKQDALDALCKGCGSGYCGISCEEYIAIKNLPSAQPEIIRCKDCKFWTHIKRTKRHWCKTDDGLYDLNTSADDFCSRAKRRTDEPDR